MMSRIRLEKWTVAGAALVFGLCAAPTARALDNSALDMLTLMQTKPSHFVLFDDGMKPLDFATARMVNICVQPQHTTPSPAEEIAAGSTLTAPAKPVPLSVIYDGKSATVRPGNCLAIKAKQVAMRPARDLERAAQDVPLTHYRDPELSGTITALR